MLESPRNGRRHGRIPGFNRGSRVRAASTPRDSQGLIDRHNAKWRDAPGTGSRISPGRRTLQWRENSRPFRSVGTPNRQALQDGIRTSSNLAGRLAALSAPGNFKYLWPGALPAISFGGEFAFEFIRLAQGDLLHSTGRRCPRSSVQNRPAFCRAPRSPSGLLVTARRESWASAPSLTLCFAGGISSGTGEAFEPPQTRLGYSSRISFGGRNHSSRARTPRFVPARRAAPPLFNPRIPACTKLPGAGHQSGKPAKADKSDILGGGPPQSDRPNPTLF